MAEPKGLLSLGIKLSYKAHGGNGTFAEIPGLQEIPDLGGEPEKVDVTTLANATRRYINGIKDYDSFSFTFLYDNTDANSSYRICKGIEDAYIADPTVSYDFQVEFPDETKFTFEGNATTSIVGQSVNSAIQFNFNISLLSDITVTNPV